jgi:hypothetical protein
MLYTGRQLILEQYIVIKSDEERPNSSSADLGSCFETITKNLENKLKFKEI